MGAGQVDSAGQPWAGRSFAPSDPSADDGSAPPALIAMLARFTAREASEADVVDVLRTSRVLIPLVAQLGETGIGPTGLVTDKSADLSIVTVAGPDGRAVLPVFSSVAAMSRWNATARPVPADAVRVGLAAASEDTELVVLDPASDTEFVLRRPAVWALAQQLPWLPSRLDPEVHAAFAASIADVAEVRDIRWESGDPTCRLAGPELVVTVVLEPGLDADDLASLLARLQAAWAADEVIATRVDSLALRVRS
ncbi:MAG: SseB family protein [Burkholderiaceae bacterium]|nr:SseB family protein [Microbacteriaceae bacterium]